MTRLERAQRACLIAVVAIMPLGLMSAFGVPLLPAAAIGAIGAIVPFLYPLFALMGIAAGVAAELRGKEIDRRRWELVEEPLITDDEREMAHREAESQRRHSAMIFLVVPLGLAYLLVDQLATDRVPFRLALLGLLALVGFFAGLAIGRWRAEGRSE